jgi:hypothetical protein
MLRRVLFWRDNDEVLRPVIVLVPVDVMHELKATKAATELSLHHESML